MTAGAQLRSKAAGNLLRGGPRGRGRARRDEEAAPILELLELGDAAAEGAGLRGARRVHLAVLPERYEPLAEPVPEEQPRRKYRQRLKKYGKVGARARPPAPAPAPGRQAGRTSPLPRPRPGAVTVPRRSASPGCPPTPTASPAFAARAPKSVQPVS